MRATIVTDVHANLAALQAVLMHAESQQALDAIWSMGDLVGYGPEPSSCLALLRQYAFQAVAGNHDVAAVGGLDTRTFNPAAAAASTWTGTVLDEAEHRYLKDLPQTFVEDDLTLVHGSLRDPIWEYMITLGAALDQFEHMSTPYSLVGHTHVPLIFEEQPSADPTYHLLVDGELVELGATRLIMNPGSVGQPRDGDPRAAYAVYDSETRTLTFHRVAYDIERTQQAMQQVGLPVSLITRLSRGR
jgi:diadenosine tetraphosphatase ApaH/serine/threonine PP2A family protein phosphatase